MCVLGAAVAQEVKLVIVLSACQSVLGRDTKQQIAPDGHWYVCVLLMDRLALSYIETPDISVCMYLYIYMNE